LLLPHLLIPSLILDLHQHQQLDQQQLHDHLLLADKDKPHHKRHLLVLMISSAHQHQYFKQVTTLYLFLLLLLLLPLIHSQCHPLEVEEVVAFHLLLNLLLTHSDRHQWSLELPLPLLPPLE